MIKCSNETRILLRKNTTTFMTKSIFFILIAVLFIGCEDSTNAEQSEFEGLWIVKSVKVGDTEMTPHARWTRFNSDATYESGNGKFQHTYGTWKVDEQTNKLSFDSSNGVKDVFEAFELSIQPNKMTWKRTEEGRKITVELERSDKLPESYGDRLVGLWSLKTNDETIPKDSIQDQSGDYLFFRWDKRFVMNTGKGVETGTYRVDGHNPEVSLIPDDPRKVRTRWKIIFNGSNTTLKDMTALSRRTKELTRIHEFPE